MSWYKELAEKMGYMLELPENSPVFDPQNGFVDPLAGPVEKIVHQLIQLLQSRAQWRHGDGKDVETV